MAFPAITHPMLAQLLAAQNEANQYLAQLVQSGQGGAPAYRLRTTFQLNQASPNLSFVRTWYGDDAISGPAQFYGQFGLASADGYGLKMTERAYIDTVYFDVWFLITSPHVSGSSTPGGVSMNAVLMGPGLQPIASSALAVANWKPSNPSQMEYTGLVSLPQPIPLDLGSGVLQLQLQAGVTLPMPLFPSTDTPSHTNMNIGLEGGSAQSGVQTQVVLAGNVHSIS